MLKRNSAQITYICVQSPKTATDKSATDENLQPEGLDQLINQNLKKNQNGRLSWKLLQLEQNGRCTMHSTLV